MQVPAGHTKDLNLPMYMAKWYHHRVLKSQRASLIDDKSPECPMEDWELDPPDWWEVCPRYEAPCPGIQAMMVTNKTPQMIAPLKFRDMRIVMRAKPARASHSGASSICNRAASHLFFGYTSALTIHDFIGTAFQTTLYPTGLESPSSHLPLRMFPKRMKALYGWFGSMIGNSALARKTLEKGALFVGAWTVYGSKGLFEKGCSPMGNLTVCENNGLRMENLPCALSRHNCWKQEADRGLFLLEVACKCLVAESSKSGTSSPGDSMDTRLQTPKPNINLSLQTKIRT